MKTRRDATLVITLALFLTAIAGCAGRDELVPETASSATSPTYAEEFPDRLTTIRQLYVEQTKQAREDTKALPTFPNELAEPDWALVAKIMEEADAAGRSQAVVDELRAQRHIKAFLEDNDRELGRRIGIHVNSVLKQRGGGGECEYPVGPGTARAIDDAFDRQLEDRYKTLNEAYQLLARNEEQLGRENVAALESQIDRVTKTSFTVYVDAVMLRNELDRLLEEMETIGETIDNALAEERRVSADPQATKAQKTAADERIERLQAAKSPLDGLAHNAEQTRETMDEDIVAMRQEYQAALDRLVEDLTKRAQ